MTALKRAWRGLDTAFEWFSLLCLVSVVFVVLWQIFGRQVLGSTPSWSEETARILLVWIGFLAAALGFRDGAHIAISYLVDKFPIAVQRVIGRFIQLMILVFALYLIIQGAQFTVDARHATLPGTGLPRSVLYVMMPVAGTMLLLYTVLQAFGVRTQRHGGPADDTPEPEGR